MSTLEYFVLGCIAFVIFAKSYFFNKETAFVKAIFVATENDVPVWNYNYRDTEYTSVGQTAFRKKIKINKQYLIRILKDDPYKIFDKNELNLFQGLSFAFSILFFVLMMLSIL